MINNNQSLVSASTQGGSVRIWDDGFGPLWVYRETLGVKGVVRARVYSVALDCVIDEIMDDPDPEDVKRITEEKGDLPECVYWRSSGCPSNDGLYSPLAQDDVNGSSLAELTPELAEELGLKVEIKDDDEEPEDDFVEYDDDGEYDDEFEDQFEEEAEDEQKGIHAD